MKQTFGKNKNGPNSDEQSFLPLEIPKQTPQTAQFGGGGKKKNLKFALEQNSVEQEFMKRKRAMRFAKHFRENKVSSSPQPVSVFSRIDKRHMMMDDDFEDDFYVSKTPEVKICINFY